jgi:DNA-binding NtrC family response regulator
MAHYLPLLSYVEEYPVKYNILLIDDEQLSIDTTLGEFEDEGDLVFSSYTSPRSGIEALKKSPDDFAVVLLDYNFPAEAKFEGTNGALVAKELLAINPKLNIVILSGDSTREAAIRTLRAGVVDFVDKNAPRAEKIEIVRNFCRKFDEVGRVLDPKQFEDGEPKEKLLGKSPAIVEVLDQTRRIRESSSTVLIRGESGTGKELVALAVHNNSARKGRPFIAINCGAIPEKLIESELFGHEKGAFTDAVTKKIGKFQLAQGGTIFLDEIGDMPLDMQVKLLRVLQEGTIDPLGSRDSIRVNVRVVAATNVNLEEAVKAKRFREDLYYRLNVIPLVIPPLRERKEDIDLLVAHFVRKHPTGSKKKFLASTLKHFHDYA